MSFWKDLFGGGIVSKGVDMLDDAVLTDQEAIGLKAKLLSLYEPYKLAQRFLRRLITQFLLFRPACYIHWNSI